MLPLAPLALLCLHVLGATAASSSVTASSSAAASSSSATSSSSYNDTAILSSGYTDLGEWQDAYDQASAWVQSLTSEEKILLITGQDVPSKNFTAIKVLDGTTAPNNYYFVSTFPVSSALAMTWDKNLVNTVAKAIGSEHFQLGTTALDGPVTCPLGRSPWNGRFVESLGPDAYANGVFFGKMVEGISESGLIVVAEHFALYEQETNRQVGGLGGGGGSSSSSSSSALSDSYSVQVDDKALHETYLRPWYDGVKSGIGAAMCSMNRINETYACENAAALNKLLKTEIGFPGYVTADVGGQKTVFDAAISGMDHSSTQYWSNATMLEGLSNGTLSETRLDDMCIRNVLAWFKHGLNSGDLPAYVSSTQWQTVRGNHSALIRDAASQSITLLKNNGVLPLTSSTRTMGLFGAHAGPVMGGPNYQFSVTGEADTYQGHLAATGGSGTGSFSYLITPHQALTNIAEDSGMMLWWIMNNTWTTAGGSSIPGVNFGGGTGAAITIEDYAEQAEASLVFLNAWSGEGADRGELRNTEQDELVTSVAASCNNTIVIVNTVGPRILDAWIDNENVTAVLYASMLGQQSGNSIVDVLYGRVNPSGRLHYTIAKNESDYDQFTVCEVASCNFTEGNNIDYKWFDAQDITPRFEFGYGLSYTTFSYGDLAVEQSSNFTSGLLTGEHGVGGRADLWDTAAKATIQITNNGTLAGSEIVQLYMSFPDVAGQPIRQLRGFEKATMDAGASSTVTFELLKRDFTFWNVTAQEWAVAEGEYTLYAAASSRDLRAQTTLTVS